MLSSNQISPENNATPATKLIVIRHKLKNINILTIRGENGSDWPTGAYRLSYIRPKLGFLSMHKFKNFLAYLAKKFRLQVTEKAF